MITLHKSVRSDSGLAGECEGIAQGYWEFNHYIDNEAQ